MAKILVKFHENWRKNCRVQRLKKVLKKSNLVTWFLTRRDPYSDLIKISLKKTLVKFHKGWCKTVTSIECEQGFIEKWPSDLVFKPTGPTFQPDRDIIKPKILVKFFED